MDWIEVTARTSTTPRAGARPARRRRRRARVRGHRRAPQRTVRDRPHRCPDPRPGEAAVAGEAADRQAPPPARQRAAVRRIGRSGGSRGSGRTREATATKVGGAATASGPTAAAPAMPQAAAGASRVGSDRRRRSRVAVDPARIERVRRAEATRVAGAGGGKRRERRTADDIDVDAQAERADALHRRAGARRWGSTRRRRRGRRRRHDVAGRGRGPRRARRARGLRPSRRSRSSCGRSSSTGSAGSSARLRVDVGRVPGAPARGAGRVRPAGRRRGARTAGSSGRSSR